LALPGVRFAPKSASPSFETKESARQRQNGKPHHTLCLLPRKEARKVAHSDPNARSRNTHCDSPLAPLKLRPDEGFISAQIRDGPVGILVTTIKSNISLVMRSTANVHRGGAHLLHGIRSPQLQFRFPPRTTICRSETLHEVCELRRWSRRMITKT